MGNLGQQFADLIAERLKTLGASAFSVEQAAGLPPDAIRNAIRSEKRSGPTLSRVQEICDALGLELYIGPPRDTGPVEQVSVDGAEFARIPVHQAALGAGGGVENHREDLVGHLAFRRAWLRQIGVSAAQAVLARAAGDSMAPTIHDGDMLLIDRSRAEPPRALRAPRDTRPAPIHAVLDEGAARVKRIELAAPGTLALLSDNPAFAPEFRPVGSVQIIGRVMWWGHTNRE